MMSCAHAEEIEDLVMGFLACAEAERACAHLASCASCREEHDQLTAERSLFERRAAAIGPAPFLAVEAVAHDRRRLLARATPVVLALAACAAVIAGLGQLETRYGARSVAMLEGQQGVCGTAQVETDRPSESEGEPLACAFPVSGIVRVAQANSDEGLACVVADRATCEERVTSSIATP